MATNSALVGAMNVGANVAKGGALVSEAIATGGISAAVRGANYLYEQNKVDTPPGYDEPIGDTYRGIFGDWFNGKNIAKEDYLRNEQAANNQLQRDLYLYEKQKEFAREQMSWEERMSNSSFQRAVADMKKAGINPVMAINQGGASTPSAPSASAGRSSGGYRSAGNSVNTTGLVGSLISLIAGVYGAGAKNATQLAIAQLGAKSRDYYSDMGMLRDEQWRFYYDKHRR